MATRNYPTNAARGGATTLTGGGSSNDVFTFAAPVQLVVQNNTGATIYVASGTGASSPATAGDEAVPSGAEYVAGGDNVWATLCTWVAIYGAAGTKVNGTAAGGIVVYGVG